MKTFVPSMEDVKRTWHIVDASGKNLGRTASLIAMVLMGKHKPEYMPNIDTGDFVIVVNADKVAITGNKIEDKMYYHHSGYPGGLKSINLKGMLEKHPERVLENAVSGMLPKNKLRDDRMKRLKVYCNPEHPHKAQKPVELAVE